MILKKKQVRIRLDTILQLQAVVEWKIFLKSSWLFAKEMAKLLIFDRINQVNDSLKILHQKKLSSSHLLFGSTKYRKS